jgi:6-phosphogluconolactonase
MKRFNLFNGIVLSALLTLAGTAQAATFVYVSNAEDGNIGMYTLTSDGTLRPGPRVNAGKPVMPMSVSPDKRFLYAAVRSKPFTVVTYAIDARTGALEQLSTAPLAESFPYIQIDRTGRWLLGASYGAHLVSVNPVAKDGKVSEPIQVIPTARNAHAIITDKSSSPISAPTRSSSFASTRRPAS